MVNMKLCRRKLKVILVPYPAQGHVTPMLKLASAFLSNGLMEPVLVTPEFIHQRIISSVDSNHEVSCMSIPDGLEKDAARDFFAIEKAMENTMPGHLEKLVRKVNEDGRVVCVVVDLLASWAIEVAEKCGVPVAGFWPAMLATYRLIAAIPDMVQSGYISDDTGCPQHVEEAHLLPNQPMLSAGDLPWLIGTPSARKSRFKFWMRTLDRSRTLRWLLVNSFPEECIDIKQQYQLNGSSPCQPFVYLVGPLSQHAVTKNPSFWEEDMSCIEWLDKQKPNSVIYISFGSWVSPIGEAKVKSLALALEASGLPFIWALGSSWRAGLPVGYLERVSRSQGKVVSWAPQMKVLQHRAVGCYLTHCGWNSTMEAIQCQKPLLCYPVAGDQFVNCAYIVKIWKIGVKINGFGSKDIEGGLKRAMEDSEMSNRLMWLHKRTVEEDARSRVIANLTAFVEDLDKRTTSDQSHLKRVNYKDVHYFNF